MVTGDGCGEKRPSLVADAPFLLAISLDCTLELCKYVHSGTWIAKLNEVAHHKRQTCKLSNSQDCKYVSENLHVWSPRAFLHRWPKVEPLVEEPVLILSESHSVTAS